MADGKRNKVLIIDNEPLNIRFFEALISDEIDVIFATSGEDALAIVHSGQPDLILLDVVMPGMDGYEVCRRLKADPQTEAIPVIFVTAKQGEEEEAKGLDLGAVDYITKPFNPDIVKRKVTNQIQRITSPQPKSQQERAGGSGRRASDQNVVRPWIIAAGMLFTLAGGTIISLQMGLIPWPAATSQFQQGASATGSATSSENTDQQKLISKSTSKSTLRTDSPSARAARRQASLQWLKETKCREIPRIDWWRFNSHQSIARYVTRNLKGDWQGYLDKWRARLDNVEDIYARNSNAVTGTGVNLSGQDLADYIGKMKIRVEVIECLHTEAVAYAQALERG